MDPERYTPIKVELPDAGASVGGGDWGGPGFPVLGVQGLTSNHRLFELLAQKLPEHRLMAMDARGRASGYGLPCPDGLATHADDLVRLLDAAAIEKAVVVGHSMGGFAGLRFAQRHPARVQGLVLVDGGPPVKLPGILRSEWAVRTAFKRKLPSPSRTWQDLADLWTWMGKRAAGLDQLDRDFVGWAFSIDLAGPPGAMKLQHDLDVIIPNAIECFTAPWRAEALASLELPCRIVLAEWGEAHGKKPLYRKDIDPGTLAPGTTQERIPGTDHVEVLWHERTLDAISSFMPA